MPSAAGRTGPPMTLNVSQNTSAIMPIKQGRAVYLPWSGCGQWPHCACAIWPGRTTVLSQTFNKVEPHIRQRRFAVQTRLTFQLGNRVTKQLSVSFASRSSADLISVSPSTSLKRCGKTQRQPGAAAILDRWLTCTQRCTAPPAPSPGVAEVNAARCLAV